MNPFDEANEALVAERNSYLGIAKHPDTSEQFGRFYQLFGPWLARSGGIMAEPPTWPDTDKPRIGFVMDNATGIAHGANLFELLKALEQHPQPIEPVVFSKEAADDKFKSNLSGAEYHCFGSQTEAKCWLQLRTLANRLDITALVWVSIVPGLIFSNFIKAAPVVIWWSQKWHTLHCKDIGLIDTTHPFWPTQELAGQEWRSARLSLPRLLDVTRRAEAEKIRNELAYQTVFGWFGREEKLFDPYFADSVVQILKANENSCFLWTSRSEHGFGEYLDQHVPGRHRCLGWVDCSLWSMVVDVGLDTFPFGMGHTAFQLWEADKPVIGVANENPGALNTMYQLVEEGPDDLKAEAAELISVKPYTETIVDFIELAGQLHNDRSLQKQMGTEGRLFIETFLRDRQAYAATMSTAIVEIIEEKRTDGD